jgi:predicted membrane protein DUF2079
MISPAVGVLGPVRPARRATAPVPPVAPTIPRTLVDRDDLRLRAALQAAWVLLGAQFVAMLAFSWEIYHRFANTWDYALNYQGWWAIAHGNLDPFSTVAGRFLYQDHFVILYWPLAPISLLWPHGLWPLWIQDLLVVGGEVAAVLIVRDAVRSARWSPRLPGWMAVCVVTVMLVANPWIYNTIAFDFHYESVGAACFALLACRELMSPSGSTRRLVLWSALCLACGDIAATLLIAVGIGAALASPANRRRALALVGIGFAWFAVVSLAGGNQGSNLAAHYGYLAGLPAGESLSFVGFVKAALLHPMSAMRQLWAHRVNTWGYVSSAGLIGLWSPWAVLPVLVLVQSELTAGDVFASSDFQNLPVVLFLIPLSVIALARFGTRLEHRTPRPRSTFARSGRAVATPGARARGRGQLMVPVLAGIMALNAVAWGLVWIPQVSAEWIRVSPAAATALEHVDQLIPANAEVVASQGVIGRFSGRRYVYAVGGDTVPLKTDVVYFVITPTQGIEEAGIQTQEGILGQLAGPLHGRLLFDRAGVWLIALRRPPGATSVSLPKRYTSVPAWVGRSATGTRVTVGPESTWHMAKSTDAAGYVLFGNEWNELPGTYEMTTTISNTAPVNLEVWDASSNTLLTRQRLVASTGIQAVQTAVRVTEESSQHLYSGSGPFRFDPPPAPLADAIEVRVWSSGSGEVSVYSVELQRIDR